MLGIGGGENGAFDGVGAEKGRGVEGGLAGVAATAAVDALFGETAGGSHGFDPCVWIVAAGAWHGSVAMVVMK